MENSPIFLLGCPRSGTTLLRGLLRAHSRISFPTETHFIPQLYQALGNPPDEAAAHRLVRILLRQNSIRSWGCDFDAEKIVARRTYAGIVDEIFQHWLRQEGKPRWGDKTPHNVLHIPVLAALFPDAKFIHVVRDGRDVAASWRLAAFGPENLYTAAAQWKRFVETGVGDGAALGEERYRQIRYEDLLTDTEKFLRELCTFLGEEFETAMFIPHLLSGELTRIQQHRLPLVGGKKAGFVKSPEIVYGNHGKWKTTLSLEERALVESAVGSTLERLGYETEGLARPIPRIRVRWWTLDSKIRETILRLNSAPLVSWAETRVRVAVERLRLATSLG